MSDLIETDRALRQLSIGDIVTIDGDQHTVESAYGTGPYIALENPDGFARAWDRDELACPHHDVQFPSSIVGGGN